MPYSPGSIRVDPNGQTAVVTFTLPGGGTPVAYDSRTGSGTVSLPASVSAATTFWFQEATQVTVSALVGGVQQATASGTTANVDLSGGGQANITVALPAASGSPATSVSVATFDAAGDLLVGTGNDVYAKLTKGSPLQQLRVNAAGTGLEYADPVASGLSDRGAWATTTVYAVGDVVTQASTRYACRTAHTAGTFATDLAASKWVSLDGGASGAEDVTTVASSGASQTLTLPAGGIGTFDVTLTAATVTLAFAGAVSGKADTLTLVARQDGTGSRTITWPGSVTWVGGSAPSLSNAAGALDILTFLTVNGGTNWYGFSGSGGTSSARGRSTGWFTNRGAKTTAGLTNGVFLAVPFDAGAVTLTQLAVQVTSAAASATVRLGIFSDNNGVPGTLLVEPTSATPLDASTTGVKTTSTFSQIVTGRVWIAVNVQGAGCTLVGTAGQDIAGVAYDTAANALGFSPTAYTATTSPTSGAMSTFTVNNATTTAPVVAAKVG